MWGSQHISHMKTTSERKVLHSLWYLAAYSSCSWGIKELKKVFFCLSTLKQLPNYRNSLGMRPNFRFVLLFMEVHKLEGEGEKQSGRRSQREGERESKNKFHRPLDMFPFSDLQLWCSLSSPQKTSLPEGLRQKEGRREFFSKQSHLWCISLKRCNERRAVIQHMLTLL